MRSDRLRADRRLWLDALLAMALAAVVVANALLAAAGVGLAPVDYLLLVGGTLPLAVRRHASRTVLMVVAVGMVGYSLRAAPDPVTAVPVLIALYTVADAGFRLVAIASAGPLIAGVMAYRLASTDGDPVREAIQQAILPVGWFIAALVAGEVSRNRRAHLQRAEQRAAEAERTREEVAWRRASQERLRIARELHDSLTHSISVIKVHAGVAVHLARKRGEPVPDALLAIQAASTEAARELRATLHVLRNTSGEPDRAPPVSGLSRLPDLLARARQAGLPVTLTVSGEQNGLPAAVDQAAYRIIQEALTNTTRHAGPASATVSVDYRPDTLTVQISDDGSATVDEPPIPGVGLIGMRERITALGGHLRAEPRSDGGFTVRATIPIPS